MSGYPRFLDRMNTHATGFVAGYRRDTAGNTLAYKSFHPEANLGLVTRCTSGSDAISWETDQPSDTAPDAPITYLWIAGYASGTSTADRHFQLLLNNAPAFTIVTRAKDTSDGWSLHSADGLDLAFQLQWSDWAGDRFGYMWLTVPPGHASHGKPLRLTLTGEGAGSNDWFLVFSYSFEQTVALVAQPALKRAGKKTTQVIQVVVNHTGVNGRLEVDAESGECLRTDVLFGHNVFGLDVESNDLPVEKRVTVKLDGRVVKEERIVLRPVRSREIYLLPHSHNDIGYSDVQSDVLKKQFRNIEEALELIDRTADFPEGARFKWNLEILWPLDMWLATASEQQQQALSHAISSGSMGLDALYGNTLTGICHPEDLVMMTECARRLSERFGVPLVSAMSGDIPGFIWETTAALYQAGVKFFTSGPNYQPFLPDAGDRVGHSNRAWSDRPFYWVSPSGQEKVLFWMAGKGYSWFHEWIIGKARPGIAHYVYDYMRELEQADYRYDIVQLHYTIGADNGPVDQDLPEFVKSWNAEHVSPRFVIATTAEMFKELEKRHGDIIPSFSGDLTPYWEDGALSTLKELGMVRQASERLVQAETLVALDDPKRYDRDAYWRAWKNIVLFNEHTWGAYNSVTEPDAEFVQTQWEVKQRFALDAEQQSRILMREATTGRGEAPLVNAFDVINSSSWTRTDVVVLSADQTSGLHSVKDERGNPVITQRMADGALAWLAEDVPPFGARRYVLWRGEVAGESRAASPGRVLTNGLLEAVVDERTGGIASLRELRSGREYADRSSGFAIAEYLYVPGRDPALVQRVTSSVIRSVEQGPLLFSVEIESDAPGCVGLRRKLSMVSGINRMDLALHLNKKKVRAKESVHCAFPLAVPHGRIRVDGGWCCVRPAIDQLQGACRDFLYAQRWVDVSNAEFGCTWATSESPIIEPGQLTNELQVHHGYRAWRETTPSSVTFFSYLMNNYWHTNYKADQEGLATAHYSLRPHGSFTAGDAYRFGIERNQPLVVVPAVESRAVGKGLFSLAGNDLVVTSLRPSTDGRALLMRLLNVATMPKPVDVNWNLFRPSGVFHSSLKEEQGDPLEADFLLAPWGIVTVRCVR